MPSGSPDCRRRGGDFFERHRRRGFSYPARSDEWHLSAADPFLDVMTAEYLTELARQWVAEQGEEAGAHLAEAMRELRAVGDRKGATLLAKIAQQMELIDDDMPRGGRRAPIRRQRGGQIDPSM